jgi:hypothetical protein
MKTVELKITKEDLLGQYSDIFDCPVARAFKRNFPGIAKISVGADVITDRSNPFAKNIYEFDGGAVYYNIKDKKEFTLILNEVV